MSKKRYDLHLMIALTRGNNDLILKIVHLFLRETPRLLNLLEKAYLTKDLVRFTELANEIRPSFGYFSIREIEADLELAEQLAYINISGGTMKELIERIMRNAASVIQEMEYEFSPDGDRCKTRLQIPIIAPVSPGTER